MNTSVPPASPVDAPEKLLSQMADIRGLDKISAWPPGVGWWVLLGLVVAGMVFGVVIFLRKRAWERSWKSDAMRELNAMEEKLTGKTARNVAAALSATLRRIAIVQFSRAECAGLEGQDWLSWLSEKDPRKFDWLRQGSLLTEAPYMPPGAVLPEEKVQILIRAVKEWVK